MSNITDAGNKIAFVIQHDCQDPSEALLDKKIIQESYTFWAGMVHEKCYMNWGISDKKIQKELMGLNYNFTTISDVQDLYSLSLIYYLIRPLLKKQFYNKRLLDVGSGNGIGLKVISELLATDFAVGLDLTSVLATRANKNFYLENKINYIQADAESIPLENNSIDIITNVESSHNYPRIDYFFSEIERVLAPGGYFCYTDIDIPNKSQSKFLEQYLKKHPNLKLVEKQNISKMVQAAIYDRLINKEEWFYQAAVRLYGEQSHDFFSNVSHLAGGMGLIFLPWWKIRFKKPELKEIARAARKSKFWGKKLYFYYLIQKV
ncbi:class I SAM-dependent methyltransferase [Legionella waltersii]|uniref:O-methyltransferase n=1 Tax=Legionella waltersii TaxID=66969 RepID=A0A0W1AD36_9GAMM|nr:methyltransferase domain-containing protein [Legionella waltersii]KTD79254.1 O-methyltransferase [Legionella waltersii]SNV12736.1 O-methyltransferase [Legionella waltersii]